MMVPIAKISEASIRVATTRKRTCTREPRRKWGRHVSPHVYVCVRVHATRTHLGVFRDSLRLLVGNLRDVCCGRGLRIKLHVRRDEMLGHEDLQRPHLRKEAQLVHLRHDGVKDFALERPEDNGIKPHRERGKAAACVRETRRTGATRVSTHTHTLRDGCILFLRSLAPCVPSRILPFPVSKMSVTHTTNP